MRIEKWVLRPLPMSMRISSDEFEGSVVGMVYGNPKFKDGTVIETSRVRVFDLENKTVQTMNSVYELGEKNKYNDDPLKDWAESGFYV